MQVNLNQLEIPKASAYAMQALDIVRQDEPDLKQLEQSIMHDPLLASGILRYANSPLHRRSTEVTNVPTALKLLGINSIRSAIVTATIRSMLPVESHIGQTLLTHMLHVSGVCKLISEQCCEEARDDLEFLGLVHDVGMLTLAANFERTYDKLINEARDRQISIDQLEQDEFGISHDKVTARTIESFRLPKRYGELLQGFHGREVISKINATEQRDTCILSLAHRLLEECAPEQTFFPEAIPESIETLANLLGLEQPQLQSIRQAAMTLLEQAPG